MKEKAIKNKSLGLNMVILVFLCWILPMVLMISASSFISTNTRYENAVDVTTTSFYNNMDLVQRSLEEVMNTSFNASYIPTVRKAYQEYHRTKNQVAFYESIKEFLRQDYERNSLTKSAFMFFPNLEDELSDLYFAYNQGTMTTEDSQYYKNFGKSNAVITAREISKTLDTKVKFFIQDGRQFLVRNLNIVDNHYQTYGILIIELNSEIIFESIIHFPNLKKAAVIIDGEEVFGFNRKEKGESEKNEILVEKNNINPYFTAVYKGEIDILPLLTDGGALSYVMIILVLMAFLLLGGLLFFFYKKVFKPIEALSDFSHQIEEGYFGTQIDQNALGSKEFGYLAGQMNAMSERLENQFERIYKEELALRDAKMKALQSQINPHFLGNTLENINWEARLAGDEKVSTMLEALTTMLDAALDRDQRPIILLKEEMTYVDAYLYIISQRFGKRLTVEKSLQEEALLYKVPKLILQPIIENAVEHGLALHQKGWIMIRAYVMGTGWMVIEVENDASMTKNDQEKVAALLDLEEVDPKENASSIGIRNVHQRLKLLYGEESGLSMVVNKRGHTLATIKVKKIEDLQKKTK